jgi:branched-chain amino acid transport system substrate-binding protein
MWDRRGGRGRIAVSAIAAVAALLVAGCGSKSSSSSSSAPAQTTAAAAPAPGSSNSANAIKIGVLATCGGPFALFEAEAFSGAKYALIKGAGGKATGKGPQAGVSGATIAGRPVSLSFGCSDATPDKAVAEARRLVESQKVNVRERNLRRAGDDAERSRPELLPLRR